MVQTYHREDTAIDDLALSIPNIELFLSKVNTKHSFHEFIKQAWPAIEGGVNFIDSWHIQAIAEHLEASKSKFDRYPCSKIP